MSAAETSLLLGPPLLRMTGRGFDLWIYDSQAEVLFYRGPVIAWTAPLFDPRSLAKPLSSDLPIGGSASLRNSRGVEPPPRARRDESGFRYRPRL